MYEFEFSLITFTATRHIAVMRRDIASNGIWLMDADGKWVPVTSIRDSFDARNITPPWVMFLGNRIES